MNRWDQLNREIVACRSCPRLVQHCEAIGRERRRAFADEIYWARPVPNFGDPRGRLLIVGLAPAAHGANRTGRMFTGDRSGQWLYRALHKAGFASHPESVSSDDPLRLLNCAITATCHCAPPDNQPSRDEIANCRTWFQQTLEISPAEVFLALGQIGWQTLTNEFRQLGWLGPPRPKFSHAARVEIAGGRWLLGSYHPSQQNTFTGRLTEPMFDAVFARARQLGERDTGS